MDHDPTAHRRITALSQRLAELERRVADLDGKAAEAGDAEGWGFPDEPEGGASAEVAALVAEGKTIEAIKLHREQTGAGLREAKDAIDRLEAGA